MSSRQNSEAIQLSHSKKLAKSEKSFTIGKLEEALLREFPSEDACDWDRTGLLVGERGLSLKKVAVALDPTIKAIKTAAKSGANVLLTHHPVFLEPPDSFSPASSVAQNPGAAVFCAIANKVALMNFHTTLDVSPAAQVVLPSMLGLNYTNQLLEPTSDNKNIGFGQICTTGNKPEKLSNLAARALSVFGRPPRVWGNTSQKVQKVATATGSASNLGRLCLAQGIDCLVCGEVKYHEALALADAGLSLIELGHDVSELPLVAVLAEALVRIGVNNNNIVIIDQSNNWQIPEAIRV